MNYTIILKSDLDTDIYENVPKEIFESISVLLGYKKNCDKITSRQIQTANREVGLQIKNYRNLSKVSQLELARKSDVKQSAISQFERGKKRPSESTLRKIEKALGLSERTIVLNFTSQHEQFLMQKFLKKSESNKK